MIMHFKNSIRMVYIGILILFLACCQSVSRKDNDHIFTPTESEQTPYFEENVPIVTKTEVLTKPTSQPKMNSEKASSTRLSDETIPNNTYSEIESAFLSNDYNLVSIEKTWQGGIREIKWNKDNEFVLFSTYYFYEQQVVTEWWQYKLGTNKVSLTTSLSDIPQTIWDELKAVRDILSPIGTVSPSGQYFIFMRIPDDFSPDSTLSGQEPFPKEVWIAHKDGSEAIKIGGPYIDCQSIIELIWFKNEKNLFISCGNEGPSTVFFAAADGSKFVTLGELTGIIDPSIGFAGMALSPDETKLAFTDIFGTLNIIALDDGQIISIPFGLRPNWSLDSQRLYYLKGVDELFSTIKGIWMYDLDRRKEIEILPMPTYLTDGQDIQIYAGASIFAVSPQENALIFQSQGLWLAYWSS